MTTMTLLAIKTSLSDIGFLVFLVFLELLEPNKAKKTKITTPPAEIKSWRGSFRNWRGSASTSVVTEQPVVN